MTEAEIQVEVRLQRTAFRVEEVMTARRTTARTVVEMAVKARDETGLGRFRRVLDRAARCVVGRGTKTYVGLDLEFHEYLGTCTHSRLLEDVQKELTKATKSVRSIANETFDAIAAAVGSTVTSWTPC